MAKKSVKGVDLAAGFFSQLTAEEPIKEVVQKVIKAPDPNIEEPPQKNPAKPEQKKNTSEPIRETTKKSVGGRPKKKGLKNEQFTLTMDPELYEKLKLVAEELTKGSFSALVDKAARAYCETEGIDLDKIEIAPEILQLYKDKQEKKSKKK